MNNLWQSFRSFRSFQTVRSDQVNAIHIWWLSPKNRTWDDLRWLEGMSNFGTNDSSICKHPVLCMTRIFPVKQRMIRRYKQCLLANMSFTRASWYSMILWWLMISTHLHGFLIIVADECRWYVRLQEQLLQRVCSCCKQGRMAQIYTKYHRTTETEQKTSTCINLPHSQLLDESGKPLVLRLLWQCIENWIAVIYRATWIWPWSWSITLSLKPNSCDDFQCEARNYKYSYMFSMTHHDTTTDSPRTVSETFGDQSTTEFQIVEATASFSERERETLWTFTKATCGSSSNNIKYMWNMTCRLYLWDLHFIDHRSAPVPKGPGICHAHSRSDRPPQSCWLETCFSTSEGVTLLRLKDEYILYMYIYICIHIYIYIYMYIHIYRAHHCTSAYVTDHWSTLICRHQTGWFWSILVQHLHHKVAYSPASCSSPNVSSVWKLWNVHRLHSNLWTFGNWQSSEECNSWSNCDGLDTCRSWTDRSS